MLFTVGAGGVHLLSLTLFFKTAKTQNDKVVTWIYRKILQCKVVKVNHSKIQLPIMCRREMSLECSLSLQKKRWIGM